jgi:PBP1b-binding outer membrane lipoprotein LpoB
MKKQISFILFLALLFCSCTVPQYIWPQKDIGYNEINKPDLEKKILIASRKSEFKSEIVQRIENAFQNRIVYIKIIGIEDLEYEDANQYSIVVLINTAMGWKIDRKVESFLDRRGEMNSIIVLTTSYGGDILPDTEEHQIDAISSASVKDDTEHIANIIITKINNLIK